MKSQWSVRKGSALSILGLALALVAVVFSIAWITLTNHLSFHLMGGKDFHTAITSWFFTISALTVAVVCLLHYLGLHAKSLIAGSVMLFLSAVARFAAALYDTLYLQRAPFYPFSMAYLDVLLALWLLVCVIFCAQRAIRSGIPVAVFGFAFGILIAALSFLRIGGYGSPDEIQLSGLVFCLCCYSAISLCALTWEPAPAAAAPDISAGSGRQAGPAAHGETSASAPFAPSHDVPAPDAPQPIPDGAQPAVNQAAAFPAGEELHGSAQTPRVTEQAPASTGGAPSAASGAPEGTPAASVPPVPPRQTMPLPMDGYIWRRIGTDPDGTPLFCQQQVFTDRKTGHQTFGAMAPVYYPHAPAQTTAWQPPQQQAPWSQAPYWQQQPAPAYPQQPSPQAPTTPAAQQSAANLHQIDSLLQQLQALHAKGILTDEEYAAKCKQVVERI